MLEDAQLYLQKKAKDLDLDRMEALATIQKLLDEQYPAKTRAKSLHEGVLKIVTDSAAVAGELRLRQAQLIPRLVEATTRSISRLHIQISSL